jgi:hypothetical protein
MARAGKAEQRRGGCFATQESGRGIQIRVVCAVSVEGSAAGGFNNGGLLEECRCPEEDKRVEKVEGVRDQLVVWSKRRSPASCQAPCRDCCLEGSR